MNSCQVVSTLLLVAAAEYREASAVCRVLAASAVFHESPRIMLAAVKFFLGQDEASEDSDDEGDDQEVKAVCPTKGEVYNASKKVSTPAETCLSPALKYN